MCFLRPLPLPVFRYSPATIQRFLLLIGPLPFMALAILVAGLALGAAVFVFEHAFSGPLASLQSWLRYSAAGLALAASYFAYGLALLVIAPTLNFLLGGKLKPYRGSAVFLTALRWYVHCTMTLVVRYSFLEFVTPSPFAQLYYRLMGMKIGRNVTINSTAIADPSLIEIGDGATIGMRAVIMGGVEVGARAKVLASSFVLPNTRIPEGETWAGIPAQRVELRDGKLLPEGASAT